MKYRAFPSWCSLLCPSEVQHFLNTVKGECWTLWWNNILFWPQLQLFIHKLYVLWRYVSCREVRGCDENRFTLPEILAHSVYLAHLLKVLPKWRSASDSLKPPLWWSWITRNHTAARTEICGKPQLEPSPMHLLHTGSRDVFKLRSIPFAWATL